MEASDDLMATEDDAIPAIIEEDPDYYEIPVDDLTDESSPPLPMTTRAAPDSRGPVSTPRARRLTPHTRPTGQFSTEELERHTEVTTQGREQKTTAEMNVVAVDVLRMLSRKDNEDLENAARHHEERRRPTES